ncbi:unknown similar to AMEV238 [Choristoneura rosaceana entomopoxvirus 'L']|uniref:Uncharacterized protein n=1 Tax=Choristoneura rosaceana entomopoxvirus 'L' TaxID=1293539 RepID=A0ABM9QKV1_9POXV|nr:unknown similar to AMEV238 [Choristoneura rosaceana entomopoxvirus 'L']CCU56144.1 unknown similar to AMEV238 [Choristoneura rosaceana entomopoxvirus 'L']
MVILFNILIVIILICMIFFISYYNSTYINSIKVHENYNIDNIYFIDIFDKYNSIVMELLDNKTIDILNYKSFDSLDNMVILSQVYNSRCSIFYMDDDIKKYINYDISYGININKYGVISEIFNYINNIIINKKFIIDNDIYIKYSNLQNIMINNLSIVPDILINDKNYPYICYYVLTTMAMISFDNSDILLKYIDINVYNKVIETSRIIKNLAIDLDFEYFKYISNNANFLFRDNTLFLVRRKDFIGYKNNNISIIYGKLLLYKNILIITNYVDNNEYFGNYIIIKKHYIDYINKLISGCFNIKNNKYNIIYDSNNYKMYYNEISYNKYILKNDNNITIDISNDILLCKSKIINKVKINRTINITKNIDYRIVSEHHIIKIDKKIFNKNNKIYNCSNISIYDNIYGNIFYKFYPSINTYIEFHSTNLYDYYEINILNPRNIIIEYNYNIH